MSRHKSVKPAITWNLTPIFWASATAFSLIIVSLGGTLVTRTCLIHSSKTLSMFLLFDERIRFFSRKTLLLCGGCESFRKLERVEGVMLYFLQISFFLSGLHVSLPVGLLSKGLARHFKHAGLSHLHNSGTRVRTSMRMRTYVKVSILHITRTSRIRYM